MPMIPKKDGSETYSMNPAFGRAVEKARDGDEAESTRGKVARVEFEVLDDGTITSTCHYKAAKAGESTKEPNYIEPSRSSHASADEAAQFLREKLGS